MNKQVKLINVRSDDFLSTLLKKGVTDQTEPESLIANPNV